MKKILTLLTGIVFSIPILSAGGCSSAGNPEKLEELKEVTIYLMFVFEENGKKHLKMFDSNDPANVVVDNLLVTDVQPGTKVIWKFLDGSGIDKIEKIGPKNRGEIITIDAKKILFKKDFMLKIPKNAKPGQEKYDIVFEDKDGNTVPIDPYLRIPDQ